MTRTGTLACLSAYLPLHLPQEENEQQRVWEKSNHMARDKAYLSRRNGPGAGAGAKDQPGRNPDDILTKVFLRKYVHYVKNRIVPKVSALPQWGLESQ